MTKKYKALDVDGMPLSEQIKLLPELRKKYQITIQLSSGRVRYVFGDSPKAVEVYAKMINAKILKVKKL